MRAGFSGLQNRIVRPVTMGPCSCVIRLQVNPAQLVGLACLATLEDGLKPGETAVGLL